MMAALINIMWRLKAPPLGRVFCDSATLKLLTVKNALQSSDLIGTRVTIQVT